MALVNCNKVAFDYELGKSHVKEMCSLSVNLNNQIRIQTSVSAILRRIVPDYKTTF